MGLLANFFKSINSLGTGTNVGTTVPRIRAFQIIHATVTSEQYDPDFEVLDNTNSERSDWFEYWPIRNFLRTNRLQESTLYGFISPRFSEKTGLSGEDVFRFIESSGDADVFTFSPYPCHSASFLNVFEQHNFFDPGFLQSAIHFFDGLAEGHDLLKLVNHSGNTVFCNFFLAKPRFWKEWVRICDFLFQSTEANLVNEKLSMGVHYAKANGDSIIVQRKVFLMERVASYLLATKKDFSVINFPTQNMPIAATHALLRTEMLLLDQLKHQYAQTGHAELLERYRLEQTHLISKAWPGHKLPAELNFVQS